MTDDELMAALDGLFAYDSGATDSGIHDPALKERVKAELNWGNRDHDVIRATNARLSRIARQLYLTDEQIEQGYGLEDIRHFAVWLDDGMRP